MSQEFLARILEQKVREVEQMELEQIQPLRKTYRLAEFLKDHQDRLQVIAEVKKASPSLGAINLDVDIVQQAQTYEANGAVMISVLTFIDTTALLLSHERFFLLLLESFTLMKMSPLEVDRYLYTLTRKSKSF